MQTISFLLFRLQESGLGSQDILSQNVTSQLFLNPPIVCIAHLLLYKIKIYSFLSFPFWPGSAFFLWIRTGQKHADPDPKHCFTHLN